MTRPDDPRLTVDKDPRKVAGPIAKRQPARRPRRPRARTLWLLLAPVLAAGVWALAQQVHFPLPWRAAAAVVAAAVPLIINEIRERLKQDDEYTATLRATLRLYSRRGIPTVDTVRDLTRLRVSPSRDPKRTPYVPRDRDPQLDQCLSEHAFVLLIGDSKAGKTRMAAEAIRRSFASRRLIYPEDADALSRLLNVGLALDDCVIWLDDLQRYLVGNAVARLVDQLEAEDAPSNATIVATIRSQAFEEFQPHEGLQSPYWPVLQRATRVRIDRLFTAAEKARAAQIYQDPRTIAALDRQGLAEYLAAGPDLVERLESGMISEPVGALVVLIAADWHRAGYERPMPKNLLLALVPVYAQVHGMEPPDAADIQKAMAWAQKPMYAASALVQSQGDAVDVFDYVQDHLGRRDATAPPERLWEVALASARDGEEALRIGLAASEQHRTEVAILAFQVALRDTGLVNAPSAAFNYACMLEGLGRNEEAEAHYRRAGDAGHVEGAYAAARLLSATRASGSAEPDETDGQRDALAERYYRVAAAGNHIPALLSLGRLLRQRAPKEAQDMLARASALGSAEAAYAIGQMLEELESTDEARRYYQLAAERGHAAAMYSLGLLLQPAESDAALRWFRGAAELGHPGAAYSAGRIHQHRGEAAEAERFYRMASRADDVAAGRVPEATDTPGTSLSVALTQRGQPDWAAALAPVAVLDTAMRARTDDELRLFNGSLRRRAARGEPHDALLPEAFATIREAVRRITGTTCSDYSVTVAAALNSGRIVEVQPGEPYGLSFVFASHLWALAGRGVHIMIPDTETLSRRFAAAREIHRFLGMQTGLSTDDLNPAQRVVAYQSDVTYATPDQFMFDFLHDSRAWSVEELVTRGRHFALVDEADVVLLEDARESCTITRPLSPAPRWFNEFARIARLLAPDVHYVVDHTRRTVEMTLQGIACVEDILGVENLYVQENVHLVNHLTLALKAKELRLRDRDYLVHDGQLRLLEPETGIALSTGGTFDDGLQQAIQAKEHIEITGEPEVLARIYRHAFVSQYKTLAGTAQGATGDTDAYRRLYRTEVADVPAGHPSRRINRRDVLYRDDTVRNRAVAELIAERHTTGQPILVDVATNDDAASISELLAANDVPVRTVTTAERRSAEEGLTDAAAPGSVVIAVNIWHNHQDIPLGRADGAQSDREAVMASGGLLVIGCGRRLDRRHDIRLANLAGRRGEPGEAVFYLARTDPLMRDVPDLGARLAGELPLSGAMLDWGIRARQRLIASTNLQSTMQSLRWDTVVEKHRRELAQLRDRVLAGEGLAELTDGYMHDTVRAYVQMLAPAVVRRPDELDRLNDRLASLCGPTVERLALTAAPQQLAISSAAPDSVSMLVPTLKRHGLLARRRQDHIDRSTVQTHAMETVGRVWQRRIDGLGEAAWFELQRRVLLSVIDREWCDYLSTMWETWEEASISRLRGADPLLSYERAGQREFETLLANIREHSTQYLLTLEVVISDD